MQRLKIAIGATLHKKVQKNSTGGTETFVYMLSSELVKRGHKVSVYAAGDSQIEAELFPISREEEINKIEQNQRLFYGHQLLESQLISLNQEEFDVIHINYFEPFLFTPFSKLVKKPIVYTVHSDIFLSEAWQRVTEKMVKASDLFVFVSKAAFDKAKIFKNKTYIHNGIDIASFPYANTHSNYLLWLGRVRKKKGIKEAVEVGIASGEKLILAGVIDNPKEKNFFESEVEPLIKKSSNIEFIGPVNFEEKLRLYQGAKAFLCPITWEEPFGLTMVEALVCGTPVIAFDRGAVREIVDDGKTGFIVDDVDGMVEKLQLIDKINRQDCRKRVEEKFSLIKMVDNYEALYYKIASR